MILKRELKQKEQEWLEKGEKRASMNASEKAQADLEEQRQALKEQQDRLQEKLDEADRKDALAATKTVLTDKHIPAEFAEFISAPILKFGTKIIRFCVIMIKIRIGVFL